MRIFPKFGIVFTIMFYCVAHVRAFNAQNNSQARHARSIYGAGGPAIPKACLYMKYCHEKPEDYPNIDFLDEYDLKMFSQSEESDNDDYRMGSYSDFGGCETDVGYENLVWILQDNSGKWYYVVQRENFEQRVTTMKCKEQEAGCYREYAKFPKGFETFCQQKYSKVQLVVLDRRGNVKQLPLEYESCCVCKYRSTI